MEIEINSNQHKLSNNKLRYYFNDLTKFENNYVLHKLHHYGIRGKVCK